MLGSGLSCRVLTGLCVVLRVVLWVRQIVFPRAVLLLGVVGFRGGLWLPRALFLYFLAQIVI